MGLIGICFAEFHPVQGVNCDDDDDCVVISIMNDSRYEIDVLMHGGRPEDPRADAGRLSATRGLRHPERLHHHPTNSLRQGHLHTQR
jgi:hypothetical protein